MIRNVWGQKLTRFRGINEGRQCAREVDLYLMHSTRLAVTGGIVLRATKSEMISMQQQQKQQVLVVA